MHPVIGLSGSLRRGSYNSALLAAAADLFPGRIERESIRDIPLYDGDLEAEQGIPGSVTRLKERIAAAPGLLLVTPEYNNSMPGVFKNAVDWLTRPTDDIGRVFHGKPVALLGATPGGFGTNLAQNAWLPVLRTLRTRPWFEGRLMVSRAPSVFDEQGKLVDDAVRKQLETFLAGFLAFSGA